jgi:hypothetical protein
MNLYTHCAKLYTNSVKLYTGVFPGHRITIYGGTKGVVLKIDYMCLLGRRGSTVDAMSDAVVRGAALTRVPRNSLPLLTAFAGARRITRRRC